MGLRMCMSRKTGLRMSMQMVQKMRFRSPNPGNERGFEEMEARECFWREVLVEGGPGEEDSLGPWRPGTLLMWCVDSRSGYDVPCGVVEDGETGDVRSVRVERIRLEAPRE